MIGIVKIIYMNVRIRVRRSWMNWNNNEFNGSNLTPTSEIPGWRSWIMWTFVNSRDDYQKLRMIFIWCWCCSVVQFLSDLRQKEQKGGYIRVIYRADKNQIGPSHSLSNDWRTRVRSILGNYRKLWGHLETFIFFSSPLQLCFFFQFVCIPAVLI